MKKGFTLICVLLFICSLSRAQGLIIGVKAGVNFANQKVEIGGTSDPDTETLTGYHVGGVFAYKFSEKAGIQGELLYNLVGAKQGDFKNELSYISIPILFRFNVIDILNLHAGPQFSFLASAKDEDGTDLKDFYKGSDVGIALGAGLDVSRFTVVARYIIGMTNVADIDGISSSDYSAKNNVFQLSVGFNIINNK